MRINWLIGFCLGGMVPLAGCSGPTDGPNQPSASQPSTQAQASQSQTPAADGHQSHASPNGQPVATGVNPAGNPAENIVADSPEALIKKLEMSLKAADFDAWNDIYAEPYGPVLIAWNRAVDINSAQQQLAEALRARFPNDAPQGPIDFNQQVIDNLKQLEKLTITSKVQEDDHVRMMIKVTIRQPGRDEPSTRVDSMLAIRQNDQWRLIPPLVEQQGLEMMHQMISARSQLAGQLKTIAAQIHAGKYQSMPEVEVAVQQAQAAMMQQIHPRMSQAHPPKSTVEDPFQR